ncbi:CHAT domain-containing protein [Nostoc sp.]|uniref:CHAT domain-containing protein n=1 Tax=Nostoc sp. TaxID=1180 RepID=UPI002FFB2C4D
MTEQFLYFNGINGATGEYFPSPRSFKQIAQIAQGKKFNDPLDLIQLQQQYQKSPEKSRGLVEGKDPKNLAQTGWGIIFAYEYKDSSGYQAEALRDALSELLEHRRQQATQIDNRYYQEYIGQKAYRTQESKQQFLERHRVAPGPVNPEKMPYYLLIVGDPQSIPYHFQYQLDVQYAVGRIYFDTLEEYAQYAHSVVKAETGEIILPQKIYLFGTQNQDDQATQLSAEHLIKPLSQWITHDQPNWSVQTVVGESATKARLSQLISEVQTPALLFTATHGVGFPNNHPLQLLHQGALLCQDWPGPSQWKGELHPQTHYFCADDIGNDANLLGLITFHFACYSAGTPKMDDFSLQNGTQKTDIAPHAFVAQLPKRLLSRGALAVVGHIERAWGCSFVWKQLGEQLETFQSAFKRLMEGHPVGSAVEFFNQRYAELACDLNVELEQIKPNTSVDDWKIASLWTAKNDSRNYAIIGDPAVRLMVRTNPIPNTERKKITVDSLKLANSKSSTNAELTLSKYNQQAFLSQQPQYDFKNIKKNILILSANPKNTDRLRLDQEVREIQAGLERSQNRDNFEIITRWAVRTDDLRRALLDYEPEIVHFSGHGAGTDGIALENISGESQLVSTESLANLFKLFKDKVECVLLNACYSEIQAESIHRHIDCVIGMERAVTDKTLINFSLAFYDALGAGRSYAESFQFGCNNIDILGLPESSIPKIKIRNNSKSLFFNKQPKSNMSGSGNYNERIEGNYIQGNYYAISKQQNLAEAAAEIQKLLEQLAQSYPTDTTLGKMQIAAETIKAIENNSMIGELVISALKTNGIQALEQLLNHPAASFVISALEDWQKT